MAGLRTANVCRKLKYNKKSFKVNFIPGQDWYPGVPREKCCSSRRRHGEHGFFLGYTWVEGSFANT
jgi:hypothetical protein